MSTKNFQVTAQEDGKKYWISRSVVVLAKVFVVDEPNGPRVIHGIMADRQGNYVAINNNYRKDLYVLINQRGEGAPSERGKWNMPVGYLDRDERLTEACTREVMEEEQVYIDPSKWEFDSYNDDYTPGPEHTQPVTIRFRCVMTMEEYNNAVAEGEKCKDQYKGEYNEVKDRDLMPLTADNLHLRPWAFNHKELLFDELEKFEESNNTI